MGRGGANSDDRLWAASRPEPAPATGRSFLNDHLLAGVSVAGLYAEDDSDRRLVGRLARRAARRHDCAGVRCWHRNHRRDVAYLGMLLDVLDVRGVPAPAAADYRPVGMN